MANLKVGKPDVAPDAPAHTPGIKQGNATGNYEKQAGPPARRRVDRRALDRHQRRRRASRSTRGCRTSRRRRAAWRHGTQPAAPAPLARPRLRGRAAPRAVEYAAVADARASRCAIDAPAAPRSARSCSTCRSRSRRARRALRRRRAGAAGRAVRRAASAGRTTLRTLLWTRTTQVVPAFTGETRRRAARAVHLRLRGAGRALPRRAAATARCRSSSCSAARSSTPAEDGRAADARMSAGTTRPSTGCRSRSGARRWTTTSRTAPGCGSTATRFDRLAAYKARHALPSWEQTRRRAARRRRGERLTWTRSRAIADAVLYEGYMLWPYRRSALKNQRRWTFGGVYPRGAQRARIPTTRRRCRPSAWSRAAPTPRVEVRVRFLHVVERGVGAQRRRARAGRRADGRRRAPRRLGRGGRARGRRRRLRRASRVAARCRSPSRRARARSCATRRRARRRARAQLAGARGRGRGRRRALARRRCTA